MPNMRCLGKGATAWDCHDPHKRHKVILMLLKYSTTPSDAPANQETAT
jgi:hypothetical protein